MRERLIRVVKRTSKKIITLSTATVVAFSGLAAAGPLLFNQTAAAASSPSVVYDATPSPLPPNVASLGFQATSTAEFGDYVHLAGTDRAPRTVTVTMSDWALASTPANVTFCSANASSCYIDPSLPGGRGFYHPITLNIYSSHLGPNGAPDTLLATKTQASAIPWRPEADPTCAGGTAWRASDNNCYNGYAFNLSFDLSASNVLLPNDVIISVAYNTQSYGAQPIGVDGPYNSLNVGIPDGQLAITGSDDSANNVFWNTSFPSFYTDGGAGGSGFLRLDTNWSPNGTVSFQVTAASLDDVYVDPNYTAGNAGGHTFGYDAFNTIQAAMSTVAPGGTIHINNGTYSDSINFTKNGVSLIGQSEAGVIVNQTAATPYGQGISADGVSDITLKNMTVNTPVGTPVFYALQAYQANNLTLTNLAFNGQGVAFKNSSNSKVGGVDVSSSQNVTYSNVSVTGYSKNGFSVTSKYISSDTASSNIAFNGVTASGNNWAGLAFYTVGNDKSTNATPSTGGTGDITDVTFSGHNVFTNNGSQGVFVEGGSDADLNGGTAAASYGISGLNGAAVSLNNSTFSGNGVAILNYQTNSLNATSNYWGSTSPSFSSLVGGANVTEDPWFTDAGLTTLSGSKTAPDTSGNATVNNSTPQVVVSSAGQPVTVTVSSGTSNAGIDVSSLVSKDSSTATATLPQITINSASATVSIPASTIVTSSDTTWNGVITAPTVQTTTSVPVTTPSGYTTTIGTVIEVGSSSTNLTFNQAVRLLIPGQANQLVGFVRNGTFTQITTVCSADDQATVDAQLTAGGDCYINVGSDMVVWTEHFTQFVTYSQSSTPASSGSSSTQKNSTSVKTASAPQSGSTDSSTPEVLGATTPATTPKTSSARTTTPSPALAAASKPTNSKILGLQWYFWLLILAALAVAGYSVYRVADTDAR